MLSVGPTLPNVQPVMTSSVEPALRHAVVLFRMLALGWMGLMVAITLVSDRSANRVVVLTALAVAVVAGVASLRHLRADRPLNGRFLLADGLVALAVATAPHAAGARSAFFGGYPMSWVVIVSLALGAGWALAAAGAFVATQAGAWVLGAPSVPSLGDLLSVAVLASVVALVVASGAAFLRTEERRRAEAERQLEEERRRHHVAQARMEERLQVADDLHDSLLQTVRVIGLDPGDPQRVKSLARRQERELRSLIERMHGGPQAGAAAAMRAEAADVEDLFGVTIDVVAVGDTDMDQGATALVRAAREVIVNAARHSGAPRVDVTLEVGTHEVGVVVRDSGRGFEVGQDVQGHGLGAVRSRVERVGGRLSISSSPGEGTEVELSVPRVRS